MGITSASRWKVPPPTQGGPGVRSELDMGQSGSAGPCVQGCLHGTWASAVWCVASHPALMDYKIHHCRDIPNIFHWDENVLGSQWFNIPSQWFPSRDKCMLVSSQEIATTSWQLHNSQEECRHPGTCRPSVEDTYTGTTHTPVFYPFSILPHHRGCFGKAMIRNILIRLALLTERINTPWHFDVLNSHHRNLLMFLGGWICLEGMHRAGVRMDFAGNRSFL